MFQQHIQKAREQQAAREQRAADELVKGRKADALARAAELEEIPCRAMSDEDVERQAASARAEQEKLTIEANRCAEEERRTAAAFDADPESTDAALEHLKSKKRTEKAQSAARQHAESIRELLSEADRRTNIRHLTDLRGRVDVRGEIEATAARVVTIFERFHTDLTEQLQHLNATLLARQEMLDELNGLERAYGSGEWETHRKMTFDRAVVMLAERISARFGRVEESGSHGTEYGRLAWWSTGNTQLAVAEATLRIKCPTDRRLA